LDLSVKSLIVQVASVLESDHDRQPVNKVCSTLLNLL
jgi:hypothetical protein